MRLFSKAIFVQLAFGVECVRLCCGNLRTKGVELERGGGRLCISLWVGVGLSEVARSHAELSTRRY